MKIKTFPLRFTEDFHSKLKEAAYNNKQSISEFIINAIEEKIAKGK
jgi:predicted HicB family RNase H-like nuclease